MAPLFPMAYRHSDNALPNQCHSCPHVTRISRSRLRLIPFFSLTFSFQEPWLLVATFFCPPFFCPSGHRLRLLSIFPLLFAGLTSCCLSVLPRIAISSFRFPLSAFRFSP